MVKGDAKITNVYVIKTSSTQIAVLNIVLTTAARTESAKQDIVNVLKAFMVMAANIKSARTIATLTDYAPNMVNVYVILILLVLIVRKEDVPMTVAETESVIQIKNAFVRKTFQGMTVLKNIARMIVEDLYKDYV